MYITESGSSGKEAAACGTSCKPGWRRMYLGRKYELRPNLDSMEVMTPYVQGLDT